MFERGGRFVAQACGAPADAALVAAPASGLSAAALVDRVQAWEATSRAVMAAQLVDLVALEDRQRADDTTAGVGERLEGRSVGVQVGLSLSISASAGAGRVVFARTVVEQLPALLRVAETGLIGEWHLRTVTVATVGLTTAQKRVIAEQLAADIVGRAARGVRQLSPHELGQAAARRVIGIDPQAATRRFERARRARAVSVLDKHDGTAALWVKGPAEQTQLMYDEVARDARARRCDGDERPLEAIMFEQIYDSILNHVPTPGPDPMPTPDLDTEPPDTDTNTDSTERNADTDSTESTDAPDSTDTNGDGSQRADAGADSGPSPCTDADAAGRAAAGAAGATTDPGANANANGNGNANADAGAVGGAAGAGAAAVGGRVGRREPPLCMTDLAPDDPAQDSYAADQPAAACVRAGDGRSSVGESLAQRRRRWLRSRGRAEVQVVMSASTLLGLDQEPALLRGYGAIPAEIARQIADTTGHPSGPGPGGEDGAGNGSGGTGGENVAGTGDSGTGDSGTGDVGGVGRDAAGWVLVRRLFCDPVDGRLVTMESNARLFTGSLRDFAIFRDQSCRLTGGPVRDLDHIMAAAEGGPTSAHNGEALAKNPHVLRDHPHVHVRTRPPGHTQHPPGAEPEPPPATPSGSPPGASPGTPSESPPAPASGSPPGSPPGSGPGQPPRPSAPEGAEGPGDPPAPPRSVTAERAWTRWGELLDRLRANAPDLEWTFPTGHIHRSEPPPALGHGSSPTNVANPPVRPLPSDEQIAADLHRRKHRIARDQANRLALHRQRLNAPSVIEHELYLAMHLSVPTIAPDT